MQTRIFLFALTFATLPAQAQAPQESILYASPADVAAAAARSKAAAALSAQILVALPPFRVAVEYRGKPTPASIHEKTNELINIIDGSGTLIMGGTLTDEKRRDATNMTGTGITGGRSYALAKGSYVFIPAGMPHYFAGIDKEGLVITTIYIPAPQ